LYLPARIAASVLAASLACGCERGLRTVLIRHPLATAYVREAVQVETLEDRAQSWRVPLPAEELRGLRLLYDTPRAAGSTLAVVHSVVRSNHRLDPFDALVFTVRADASARRHRLDPDFFAAVLLQESGFSPDALSPAGAVGIAQFTLDTAADEGVDPFDWAAAMGASAALLGRYVNAYDGVFPDPYAAALAAYDAGPGTVAYYHGVPPYAETHAYIDDIYDRWARIEADATGLRNLRERRALR
jgi:soluble lytic murein transglycosylase-like protein